MPIRTLGILCAVLLTSKTAFPDLPGGYRQEAVRAFKAQKDHKAIPLVGFDMEKRRTMKTCVKPKGRLILKKVAGQPATGSFAFLRTVQEAYEREGIDVEVQASVSYLGVAKASVDARHSGFAEASSSSTNGMLHGFYQNEHEVEWVTSALQLTPEAQALHDKAVLTGNWRTFYDQCGEGVVIATQKGDFFSVIASLAMSDSMSASEKRTAVKVGVEIARMVTANVGVKKFNEEVNKLGSTRVDVKAAWSGRPEISNPTSLKAARIAYRNFTKLKNITDMIGFRVVPYKEVIGGFGDLAGQENLGPKRRRRVATILDGLAFYQRAISELELRSAEFARSAEAYLRQDYRRAREAFKAERGCLRGEWSLRCEDLLAKLSPFGGPTGPRVREMVDTMLAQGKTCAEYYPEAAVVNPRGYMTCLKCELGEFPVFANGKNGQCGRLDPPKAMGSVRLGLDDLDHPKKVQYEAGVYGTDHRRPDVCRAAGTACRKPRADQICEQRGFGESTYFATLKVSRSRYANGNECVQSLENQKPVPGKCRTFVTLDCACPPGTKPKGKKCLAS